MMFNLALHGHVCDHVFEPGNPDMLTEPATIPYRAEPDGGSVKAHYHCTACGRRWTLWFALDRLEDLETEDAA